jgi:ADP-ribosylglycohydrolase
MGLCVADAVGVPVEFNSREDLKRNPVIDMRGYGTYHQPPGTWSDDTSMTLCLLDSLSHGLNYDDIMSRFASWFKDSAYTPYNNVFDIGNATRTAIGSICPEYPRFNVAERKAIVTVTAPSCGYCPWHFICKHYTHRSIW